ncbi:MAG: DUF3160 domain-containing protein [Synergistaceae bacterium]|jgi:hypothetical protein|nr:DUF3160 domain-containing protein [Synergistaceae bacterium]
MKTLYTAKLPRVLLFCALSAVLCLASAPALAAESGYYSVFAEVLPIMDKPGAKYTITDGEVEDSENVWGIVVYGNRLELRASKLKGWSELLSPEDGGTLGYVETSGVENFPEYDKTEVRYYMAAKDSPELVLLPGGKDKKNDLSSYGYRLLKGEAVPSEGVHGNGEMLLLGFETDYTTGGGGIGGRYVWGRKEDFIALNSYEPDNGRLDPKRLPSEVRKGFEEVSGIELTREDYEEIKTLARSFRGNILLPGTGEFYGDNVYEQLKMALIADAATNGWDKTALEAATGTPRKIYVFVNDKSGGARLARGYVYSYYEFERPLSDGRMTDDEWKKIVYDEARAEELEGLRPAWYRELEK